MAEMTTQIAEELRGKLLIFQKNEITEHHIYVRLAKTVQQPENRAVLERIAQDELKHYREWKKYTGQEVKPSAWDIQKYYWISRIFGITFGIKLMERGEESAQESYRQLRGIIPEVDTIIQEEDEHEQALLEMLDEERLRYIGSIVLGLNDALVELTGALAGFTLALQNTRLIALTGLITGIAAALSMAASEYLSTKTEQTQRSPLRASVYTGTAYIVTVMLLILPYLVLANYYICLAVTLSAAIGIIAFFNYYVSVARDVSFRERFAEMAGLSLGIAAFSFFIGWAIRNFLGVEV
jgi:VIT1/CCC1 family predicted Fe2+/Mn2+ transporter